MLKTTKWLAVILSLTLFTSMATGCGSATGSDGDKSVSSVTASSDAEKKDSEEKTEEVKAEEEEAKEAEEAEKVEEAEKAEETEETEETPLPTIEEQVLYDGNDIKLTATGLEKSGEDTELTVLIENYSDRHISIQGWKCSVNGYMLDTSLITDLAAGEKATKGLTFETSGLKECGIENIATIEFYLLIYDYETLDPIVIDEAIKIDTSIADGYVQKYDDSGEVLVESNGVKIISKGMATDDPLWGPGVNFYIESNYDNAIAVTAVDISVNGVAVDGEMYLYFVSGKRGIATLRFGSSLEENGITKIDDVKLKFQIIEELDTIYESDDITISY